MNKKNYIHSFCLGNGDRHTTPLLSPIFMLILLNFNLIKND